ncbi:MAG: aspartate/glutamate racemase family protein [Chloroflexota bacterium]|nr:aspartate/glutamate racemase family protein [Chloroflexota bacterium]
MIRTLTFLHTSPVHVHTFNRLQAEYSPDIPLEHIVDESLLREACDAGGLTASLQQRVEKTLLEAVDQGAAVVICTCSSIGAVAEMVNQRTSTPVMRVDRPMAEEAVTRGSRIVVAATLATTLIPTRELIYDAARQKQKEVQVIDLLCDSAWRQFERGDHEAYLREVADQLQRAASQGDILVLAQASMARATELCPDLSIPVLTSPRSGFVAALKAYYATTAP